MSAGINFRFICFSREIVSPITVHVKCTGINEAPQKREGKNMRPTRIGTRYRAENRSDLLEKVCVASFGTAGFLPRFFPAVARLSCVSKVVARLSPFFQHVEAFPFSIFRRARPQPRISGCRCQHKNDQEKWTSIKRLDTISTYHDMFLPLRLPSQV
jgi:hypothetical protein